MSLLHMKEIEAICEIGLVDYQSKHFFILMELATLRDMRILYARTMDRKVKIAIPKSTFKVFYGANPRVGDYPPPQGSEYFIDYLKVLEIRA